MMKSKLIIILILVCVLFTQGCASTQVLKISEEQKTDRIELGAKKSVGLMSPSFGSNAVAITGVMFGAVGGAIGGGTAAAMASRSGQKIVEEYALPDYSQLVFESLASRIKTELPEYADINVINTPLTKESIKQSDSVLMILQVQLLSLANKSGLTAVTVLEIKDQDKEKIGLKKFTYNTKKMNRLIKMKEFQESNGALIKEEIFAAADKTVDAFIKYLSGAPKEAEGKDKTEKAELKEKK